MEELLSKPQLVVSISLSMVEVIVSSLIFWNLTLVLCLLIKYILSVYFWTFVIYLRDWDQYLQKRDKFIFNVVSQLIMIITSIKELWKWFLFALLNIPLIVFQVALIISFNSWTMFHNNISFIFLYFPNDCIKSL